MAVHDRRLREPAVGSAQLDLLVHDPAVMLQTEHLLSGRTRDIRLTGNLVQAFRDRSWRQTAKIVRSWMVWVLVLDLLILALNLFLLPRAVATAMIAPGAIIPPAAAAVFLIWGRRRTDDRLEAGLGLGMFLILLAVSLMGIAAGGEWYERYLNVMLFVAIVGIATFNVSMRLTLGIAGTALGLYLVFQLQNPLVEMRSTISAFLFLASGITATVVARRTVTILAHKTFLLELRDKARLSELADTNARLERLSKIDHLTGVANRRWMTELLNLLWNDATGARRGIALLMCDIDEFKKLNDGLGHAAGDHCLVEVARIISSRIRRTVDQVARYGGEEFLVLLPKVTEAEAREIAERIREGVAAATIPNPGSRVLPVVTISIGIAFRPVITGDLTPDQLQSQADAALYAAKRSGRNRVEIYRDDVSAGKEALSKLA